jgi:hypothetical protein
MDVLKWYMKCNTANKHMRSSFTGIMKLTVKANRVCFKNRPALGGATKPRP